ncbi:uncharacterized protein LOC135689566 isoform X2 [Rhopilema esculentum]|uniref:uncharacterized protein LOC135689566 isoform X2 n=1 Tax=Rhopilema esculentum TaxID=499914 RepID=UPI0031D49D44
MAQRKKEWHKAESWVRRSTRGCTDFDMVNDDYVPNINEGTLQLPTSPNRECEGKEESDTAENQNRHQSILGSSAGKRKCQEPVSRSEDICLSDQPDIYPPSAKLFPENNDKDVKRKGSKKPNAGGNTGNKKMNKLLKLSTNEKGPLSTSDGGASENSNNRSILEYEPVENSSVFSLSSSSNDGLPNKASLKPTETNSSQAGSSKKISKKKGRPSKSPRDTNKTTKLVQDEKCLDDIATSSPETVKAGKKSLVKKNEKVSEKSQKAAKKKEIPRKIHADVIMSTEMNKDNLLVDHEKADKEEAKIVVKKNQKTKKMQACSDGSLDKEPVDDCKSRNHEAILSTGFEAPQDKQNEVVYKEKVGTILKKRGKPRKALPDCDKMMPAKSADGGKDQGNVDTLVTGFKIPRHMQNEVTFSNKVSKILKKRGRPRKVSICSDNDISTDQNEEINEATLSTVLGNCQTREGEIAIHDRMGNILKKRGRPKKIPNDGVIIPNEEFSEDYKLSGHLVTSSTESEKIQDDPDCKVLKKKRGRKRKLQHNSSEVLSTESDGNGTMLSDLISPVLETDGQFKKPSKKRGRPKKVLTSKDVSMIEQSGFPPNDSRKLVSTATNSLFESEHGITIPHKTKKLSDAKVSKRRKSYSKCKESLSSMEEDESCLESSLCRESSDESFEHESYIQKSTKRKPKEQIIKKRGRPPKKPVGKCKLKMLSTSKGKLQIDEEKLSQWVEEFTNGIFKCVISDCTEEFNTWLGLFKHSNNHNSEQQVFPLTKLKVPCHVCKEICTCGPMFAKHMRVVHNDIYDLSMMLDAGDLTKCFNYTCQEEIRSFNECIEHGCRCGSLVKCEKCEKTYKTRKYFFNHSCPAVESRDVVIRDTGSANCQLEISGIGARKSARKALNAISRLDLTEENPKRSRKAKKETDFIAGSSESEDSVEFEHDVDNDDDDDDDQNHAEDKYDLERNSTHMPPGHTFSSSSRISGNLSCKRVKPLKQNIQWLKSWFEVNHSLWLYPEWDFSSGKVSIVSESDAKGFFPNRPKSPFFNIVYETASKHACSTHTMQLEIFQTSDPLEGSKISNHFVGGSVLAMEWCPTGGTSDQYLAISACEGTEKTLIRDKEVPKKSLIQIWKIPACREKRSCDQAGFVMGICVDHGPVHCLEWCPSGSAKNEEATIRRLGLLAASGVDGCIHIYSIPHPEDCLKVKSESGKEDDATSSDSIKRVFIKPNPVLVLAVSRSSITGAPSSNIITCFQWQPTLGHKKIAAGFQDGSLCIWDLTSRSSLLRHFSQKNNTEYLLPFSRISAHNCRVNSLSWCPGDENFLMTVSFEKVLKVFDIRRRHTIPEISLKRNLFENCAFMRRLACFVVTEDEVFSCIPAGSRYIDIISSTKQKTILQMSDLITSHNAGCKGLSQNEWINGFVTSCTAGEVVFRACANENSGKAGNSLRVPVYRVQCLKNAKDSTPESPLICEPSAVSKHPEKRHSNELLISAKEEVGKQVVRLEDEIMENKFTFIDSNFFEFRNNPQKCGLEMDRLRHSKEMQMTAIRQQEMRQITKVKWNPNYGSHQMLASGGVLGIVRVHHFTKWM